MYDKALAHFKKHDPILYSVSTTIEIAEILPAQNYFARLTRAIIGQQLSVKAASTIFSRFEKLFPKREITPERILRLDKEKIRACGVSYPKIEYICDLAQKVADKKLILETIDTLENNEVISQLTTVKGIGLWSSEMFLMFSLARPDIFSMGDLGLKNAIKKLYKLDNPTQEQIIELSNKWSPYRTYACMILWRSLNNEPK